MFFPHASILSWSFLNFSCKGSLANLSPSPSTSSRMFFHLLLFFRLHTNLNVLGEDSCPKALCFSPATEAHGPRATSFNVVDHLEEKLRCLEFHVLVATTFDVTHVGVLKTAFHLLGLIRVHNFASSCAVFSSLPSNALLPAKLTWPSCTQRRPRHDRH